MMRITATDYARGFLSWTPIEGVSIELGTAPDHTSPKIWSGELTDPTGSLVPIDLQAVYTFKIWLKGAGTSIPTPTFWIRLERVEEGVVITRCFHGTGVLIIALRHLPNYGTYHRLVIDASSLTWDEDAVFRELGILVRFVTGEIEAERTTKLHASVDEHGKPSLQMQQRTERVSGRFIEVVTPGSSPEQAEDHAFAALGLLALALGANVLGPLVASERWQAEPSGQDGISIATGAAFSRDAAASEFELVDELLFRMTVDEPLGRARIIALRWYERAQRAEAPLDKLLSFFIGVETLVQAYAKLHAPLPIEQQRKAEDDEIVKLVGPLGKKVSDRVARLIQGASIREQFAFFASELKLGSEDTSRFDTTKKVRDSAVHGDAVDVTHKIAGDAEHLLRAMLKAAFEIEGALGWEAHPVIYALQTHFSLVPAASVATKPPTGDGAAESPPKT
jgi:hypothetical protein